jgi:DNA-binding beta-propeller fold protein YncE
MADTKITEMPAGAVSADDLLTFVDNPGGSPANKQIAYSVFEAAISITESQISDLGTYASTAYVDAAVAGLYDHKGAYDASTNIPDLDTSPSGVLKGDAYTVSVAGTFFAAAVAAGDVVIADQDAPTLESHWTIVNRNIDEAAFATATHDHDAASGVDGDVLTIQADGSIAFETSSGGSSLPVVDTTGIAKGSVDATKIVRLEVDGLTTGTTRVLTVQDEDGTIAHNQTVVYPYADNGDTLGAELAGDVLYHDGTNWTNLRKGSDDEILTLAAGLPSWGTTAASTGAVLLARCVSASNITGAGPVAAWDISTGSYATKSMSVSSQDTVPTGLAFSSDGTKAYFIGYTNDTIYQYTLSTAWDISTGSYATKSMSVSSQETQPYALAFSSDGTKAYVVGDNNLTVYQYTLSTAWDISTGSYATKSMSVSSQETQPTGLAFSSDGPKAYFIGNANDTIYQYTLSTAWDISTGSYATKSMSVSLQETGPTGFAISSDGTKAYVSGTISDTIYQYTLSTAAAADPSPIDGITLADGNRVLLAGQTDPIDNGVYDAVTATNPGTWTRISDLATAADASGRMVAVAVGTINSTSLWVCESPAGSAVVGTNDLTFTKYS